MKLHTAVGVVMVGAMLAVPAAADVSMETKRDGVIVSSSLLGAAVAGPLGFVAGSFGGAWLGKHIEQSHKVPELMVDIESGKQQLGRAESRIASLSTRLHGAERENRLYAQMVMRELELEMMFTTGSDQLSTTGKARLEMLAEFLVNNPGVKIRLEGYADPRGDDKYNLELSRSRAGSVRQLLVDSGIEDGRIQLDARGEVESQASEGNLDEYALERVVKIRLQRSNQSESVVASSH